MRHIRKEHNNQAEHQYWSVNPVLDQREQKDFRVPENVAQLLLLHFLQRLEHHDDQSYGDRYVRGAGLVPAEKTSKPELNERRNPYSIWLRHELPVQRIRIDCFMSVVIQSNALKIYPTSMMPVATTPAKRAISCGLSTLRRMIISGADRAMTLIMKASTVPSAAPLPSRA